MVLTHPLVLAHCDQKIYLSHSLPLLFPFEVFKFSYLLTGCLPHFQTLVFGVASDLLGNKDWRDLYLYIIVCFLLFRVYAINSVHLLLKTWLIDRLGACTGTLYLTRFQILGLKSSFAVWWLTCLFNFGLHFFVIYFGLISLYTLISQLQNLFPNLHAQKFHHRLGCLNACFSDNLFPQKQGISSYQTYLLVHPCYGRLSLRILGNSKQYFNGALSFNVIYIS